VTAQFFVKPQADRDLDNYTEYLAEEANLDTALRFLDSAQSTFALLATRPNIGWRSRINYPGLEQLRVFRVSGFQEVIVFYRPLSKGVEVLRVVHGSRNVRALLRREGLE
jgi:toxin ParE1/3/4